MSGVATVVSAPSCRSSPSIFPRSVMAARTSLMTSATASTVVLAISFGPLKRVSSICAMRIAALRKRSVAASRVTPPMVLEIRTAFLTARAPSAATSMSSSLAVLAPSIRYRAVDISILTAASSRVVLQTSTIMEKTLMSSFHVSLLSVSSSMVPVSDERICAICAIPARVAAGSDVESAPSRMPRSSSSRSSSNTGCDTVTVVLFAMA
mmetsp:Transcript_26734/g.66526  ORF Transcript_26734/g.66526 Transcript_26734/m.66526 type:complete len:209 (+) Transcript_26734:971-1597(+)